MDFALQLALLLIREFEGCRLRAYQDLRGVWTIGYGETLGVVAGMVWTQEQADAQLLRRVKQFMAAVCRTCPNLVTRPHALAASTSLAYNIGIGAFRASSAARHTRRGQWASAMRSILLWDKAAGRVIRGLSRRRHAEVDLYQQDF